MNGLIMRPGRNQKVSGIKWKWTHNSPKPMGHSKGSPETEVYTGLLKKERKFSNKPPNLTPTRTGGTMTNKAQESRRK